jgi:hypothetical protein
MRLISFFLFFIASFSSFSHANTTDLYFCEFKSTIQGETLQYTFPLGPKMETVILEREVNNNPHFYHIAIFEYNGRRQFQFLEGKRLGESHLSTNSFSTDISLSQESFRASTFICNSEISCWSIACSTRN